MARTSRSWGLSRNAFTLEGLGYERRAGVVTGVSHFQTSAEAAGLRAMFEGV
ncbi:hypothetical protein VXJ25_04895 [Olsenella sp. YH-ols2223]|uniref:Uncharacterized protein n=2 Tax=Olsenella absiana TaxID=3115222 RepID=A0ABU7R9Q2_9ACTN